MTKRDYLIRFLLIIKKLRNTRFATFQEIKDFIQTEFSLIDSPKYISLRTFQRDINEIRTIFNIDIQCNNSNQYFIFEDEYSDFNNRMMEAFDIFNTLSSGHQLIPYVILEKICSCGTEHLLGLLHAIKNRLVIKIIYQKFGAEEVITREVEPLALKEFKGRWYLLATDVGDDFIKTYGLDRLHELEITRKKYIPPAKLNPNSQFENCFGIFLPSESEPKEIILSFDPFNGNYIKSYPLHKSQKY